MIPITVSFWPSLRKYEQKDCAKVVWSYAGDVGFKIPGLNWLLKATSSQFPSASPLPPVSNDLPGSLTFSPNPFKNDTPKYLSLRKQKEQRLFVILSPGSVTHGL